MRIKRIFSLALSAVIGSTLLSSCTQKEPFEFEFCDESDTKKYTSVTEGSAMTVYVDVNANDGGDGSEKSPFKTIAEAQAKIREMKAGEGLPAGGITVIVKDGEYRLSEPLNFKEEDSGTAECPITYVSENEFGAVLTGGVILSASDFEPLDENEKNRLVDATARDKTVKVDLSKYGITSDLIETVGGNAMELFIDGVRSPLSRYPNSGFLRTKSVIDVGDVHEAFTDIDFDERGEAYYVEGYDASIHTRGGTFTVSDDVVERISKWKTYDDVYVPGYYKWSWSSSTPLVGKVDLDAASITLARTVTYGVSRGAPFYFLNVYEELDSEGEFFVDKESGTLYVYKTESFDNAEIMISALQGNVINASAVSNLTFKGFSLCATRGNGIAISGNDITVDNCKIFNVRNGAVSAVGNNITVQNCECFNLGSYGISISGGDSSTLTPSGNLVYNNYIHDFAIIQRTYQSAIGIGGCAVTASHNEISNSPHQAISWSGPNHVIEYNEIYDVCFETADCSAMYAGRNFTSYGTVIRYNYIHDIGHGTVHAHAIYWDDGLSGQTAYGNVIVNTSSHAFLIGGGRDNVVENNLIVNPKNTPIGYDTRARAEMLSPDDCWFTHDEEMANALVATRNDAWIEAFPIYGEIIPWYEGYEGDLDDPRLSGNPSNNSVKNNITYFFQTDMSQSFISYNKTGIDVVVSEFSDVENNVIIHNDGSDVPGYHNGDYTMSETTVAKELCPDFELIPFDKIGRE